MSGLPEGDVILASAARFLIDGGDDDAASMLLSCELSLYTSGDTWWYQGDEIVEAMHVDVSGPRAAFEALRDRRQDVNVNPTFDLSENIRTSPEPSIGQKVYDAVEAVLQSASTSSISRSRRRSSRSIPTGALSCSRSCAVAGSATRRLARVRRSCGRTFASA